MSIEVRVRGQVWEQARIVNPKAAWEADTRDGRSVVESLNRWEKTIGLYRTPSGVDISDGILVATVLEHWHESHQNILKKAPSKCASIIQRNAWLVTRVLLDLLRTKPHLLDRCRWMSIRPVQCLDSRLAKTGKGNRRERARARMERAKARARKVTRARIRSRYPNLRNSKDTVGIATNGDTSVLTAGNISPKPSRKVVRHLPVPTTEMLQL